MLQSSIGRFMDIEVVGKQAVDGVLNGADVRGTQDGGSDGLDAWTMGFMTVDGRNGQRSSAIYDGVMDGEFTVMHWHPNGAAHGLLDVHGELINTLRCNRLENRGVR